MNNILQNRKIGIKNEFNFIKSINKKKFKDMEFNIQDLIADIYENKVNPCDKFYSWSNNFDYKTDIYIRKDGEEYSKKVSIKMGSRNSVHVEPINTFLDFLKENGINYNDLMEIKKYQYKDGTLNGTGILRLSASDYQEKNQIDIDLLNKNLNSKEIILNCINRFVVNGKNSNEYIDVLINGTPDDFVYIKRNDIYKIALNHINDYSKAVHFSVLTYQTKNVNIKRNMKYEKDRYLIQIKWYNLFDHIIENMNNNYINKNI